MTLEQAMAFYLFGIVAAVTPGPSNIILTATGARMGMWRGIRCLLGVACGTGFMMFLAALGLGSMVLAHPTLLQVFRLCGMGFLFWLAWKIATAPADDKAPNKVFVGFWAAAAFQWVNPKIWLVSLSAVSAYLAPSAQGALLQSLHFGLVFACAALTGCFAWLAFGAAIQRFLRSPRARRVFHVTMGVLLAGSVLLFA